MSAMNYLFVVKYIVHVLIDDITLISIGGSMLMFHFINEYLREKKMRSSVQSHAFLPDSSSMQ